MVAKGADFRYFVVMNDTLKKLLEAAKKANPSPELSAWNEHLGD